VFLLLAAKAFTYKINVTTDNLEYDVSLSKLLASGNVIFYWENMKLYANYIEFLIDKKIINANGNIKLNEYGKTIYANSITYNCDTENGSIEDVFSHLYSTIFVRAHSMSKIGNIYLINNIKLSNCDLNKPHAYFKAKRAKLVMNKRITLYWPVFYVGKIPIFFAPLVTKSLKDKKSFASDFKIAVDSGYKSKYGLFFKTKISCPLSEYSMAEAKYDYLGTRGCGYGGCIEYLNKNKKGNINIYTVSDLIEKKRKWRFNSYYEQKVHEWDIKSEIKFVDNKDVVNTSFDKDILDRRTEDILKSYLSLVRRHKNTIFIMSAWRFDKYDKTEENYKLLSLNLPNVEFIYFPKNVFFGIIYDFTLTHNCTYEKKYNYHVNSSSLNYNFKKAFRFDKFTLKPSFTITENLCYKNKLDNRRNIFITKYLTSLNSRYKVSNWMDLDVNYSLVVRSKLNNLYDDYFTDHKIEKNMVFLKNFIYMCNGNLIIRNNVSYNLLKTVDKQTILKTQLPFKSEILWTPKHHIIVNITQTQLLNPFELYSLNLILILGNIDRNYLELGTFYKKNNVDNNLGFGLWITPKWKFTYHINVNSNYSKINEQNINLYRDCHCYNLGVKCSIKGQKYEESLYFSVKTNVF
jgi:LPS-assembly protein